MLQLKCVLKVLHTEAKMVHLDVKPGNILWCVGLQLQLCDFGMSEPLRVKIGQRVQGPEVPQFAEYVTKLYYPHCWFPAMDWWSYGCIYEVMVGLPLMKPNAMLAEHQQRPCNCGARHGVRRWASSSRILPGLQRLGPHALGACAPRPAERESRVDRCSCLGDGLADWAT